MEIRLELTEEGARLLLEACERGDLPEIELVGVEKRDPSYEPRGGRPEDVLMRGKGGEKGVAPESETLRKQRKGGKAKKDE